MNADRPARELHAVIGVRYNGPLTWYVRRSAQMENYPNVWSLLSIQFAPPELPDPADIDAANVLMQRMSMQRLSGVGIRSVRYLVSGTSNRNPMQTQVHLHLYEIELDDEPVLNPDYYSAGKWMLPAEYQRAIADQDCGLCLRLWSDYAWMEGIIDQPFVRHESS